MKKIMGAGQIILNVILGIFLVLSLFVFVFFSGMNQLFYPNVYIDALEENGGYLSISDFFEKSYGEYFSLNQEEVKTFLSGAIVNVTSYLRHDTTELILKFSIDESLIRSVVLENVGDFMICPLNSPMIFQNQIVCRAPDMSLEEFVDYFIEFNSLSLDRELDLLEYANFDYSKFRDIYVGYLIGFYVSLILSLFLLGGLYLVNRNEINSFFKVGGISFFVAGVLGIILRFVIGGIYEGFVANNLLGDAVKFQGVVNSIVGSFLNVSLIWAIVFAIIGIVLFSLRYVFKE